MKKLKCIYVLLQFVIAGVSYTQIREKIDIYPFQPYRLWRHYAMYS